MVFVLQGHRAFFTDAFSAHFLPLPFSGGSRILKGGVSAVQNVFDCARACARGRRRMCAKRQKGGFRGTQGTPPGSATDFLPSVFALFVCYTDSRLAVCVPVHHHPHSPVPTLRFRVRHLCRPTGERDPPHHRHQV